MDNGPDLLAIPDPVPHEHGVDDDRETLDDEAPTLERVPVRRPPHHPVQLR